MFAPFFALYEKRGMVIQGVFLFAFGPYLAGLITPNLMEQASISISTERKRARD